MSGRGSITRATSGLAGCSRGAISRGTSNRGASSSSRGGPAAGICTSSVNDLIAGNINFADTNVGIIHVAEGDAQIYMRRCGANQGNPSSPSVDVLADHASLTDLANAIYNGSNQIVSMEQWTGGDNDAILEAHADVWRPLSDVSWALLLNWPRVVLRLLFKLLVRDISRSAEIVEERRRVLGILLEE